MRLYFPHQEKMFQAVKDLPCMALFAQMRLGKTPVSIRWAKERLQQREFFLSSTEGRVLIVGPMSVLDDWLVELQEDGIPRSQIYDLAGRSPAARLELASGGAGWYLINYESLRATRELWDTGEYPWDVMILDESTTIRNPSAKITKVITREFMSVPFRAVLTGNPAPESEMDYFTQFLFTFGNFGGFTNYWVFRQSKFYQNPHLTWSWMPKPGTRDLIHRVIHDHAFFMTRKEAGIGGVRLPPKRRIVEMNDAQRAAYREIKKKFGYEYIETNFATVRDVWLARVAGGFSPDTLNPELLSNAKTQELIDLVKGELKGESVVVWFRFNEELHHVVEALNKAKIRAVGVTGATPKEERRPIRDRFARGEFNVICIQVKLGRFGWNLSRANTVIYYSRAYDLEPNEQSEDRVVHPTKTTPYVVIDLVTRGSIDEAVQKALKDKSLSSRSFRRKLSAEAFADFMKEELREAKKTGTGGAGQAKAGHQKESATVRRIYPGSRADR